MVVVVVVFVIAVASDNVTNVFYCYGYCRCFNERMAMEDWYGVRRLMKW